MNQYVQNELTTVDEIVEQFIKFLKETGAVSLQPYEAAEELFSARKAEFANDLYVIGNTFVADRVEYNHEPVVLAHKGSSSLVDFKRVEVVTIELLRVYLKKLVTDWIESLFLEGSHFSSETTDEEQRAEIMKDMYFWNDTFDTHWTACDPDDKVNDCWLGQYKTFEDRQRLFQ